MLLRLTYGNETISLTGATAGIRGCTYRPYSPPADVQRRINTFQSGSDISLITHRNVEEPCEIIFRGDTPVVQNALSDIQRFASLAEAGRPVFVEHRMRDTGTIYRSPLRRANIDYSDNPGLRRFEGETATGKINIAWERGYYWEGPRTQVALKSSLDGPTYGAVRTYLDGRAWVQIGANQIAGSIPTPLELRFVQNTNEQISWRNFYFANNMFNSPDVFDFYVSSSEIESGTGHLTWTSSAHSTTRIRINLKQTVITGANSDHFRVVAAFNTMSPKTYAKAHVGTTIGGVYKRMSSGTEVYTGNVTGKNLLDLGTLQIPPAAPGSATFNVGIMISMRSAGSGYCSIQGVYLLPAKNSRRLYQDGYGIPQNGVLVDDGAEDITYVLSGGVRYPIIVRYDSPIYAFPETLQRIYMIYDEASGNFVSSRSAKVQAFYRPRRFTV